MRRVFGTFFCFAALSKLTEATTAAAVYTLCSCHTMQFRMTIMSAVFTPTTTSSCLKHLLIYTVFARSHFWMALLQGKKRWVLYPKEDTPLLYPVWPEGCHDPVFEADLETPDGARNPAALLARGYQCVLEEGACGNASFFRALR